MEYTVSMTIAVEKEDAMELHFDKKNRNIYLVAAIIGACFLYMIISTVWVMNDISGQTSQDLAIDRYIDECYAKKEGDKGFWAMFK